MRSTLTVNKAAIFGPNGGSNLLSKRKRAADKATTISSLTTASFVVLVQCKLMIVIQVLYSSEFLKKSFETSLNCKEKP